MKWRWLLVGFLPSLAFGSPIEPGFDLFATLEPHGANRRGLEPAFIDFTPLGGPKVILHGNNGPLFESEGLGPTDTIVQRFQGISPFEPPNAQGTITVQLVALSLKSINPFNIDFLHLPSVPAGTMADLYVTINAFTNSQNTPYIPCLYQPDTLQKSEGTMRIYHNTTNGGSFDFTLTVNSDLIFVKAGENFYNPINWLHHLPDPTPLYLQGEGMWSHTPLSPDYHNSEYPAGYFYPTQISTHPTQISSNSSENVVYTSKNHPIVPPPDPVDPPGCQYTVQVADEFGSPSTIDPLYINSLKQLKNFFTSTPINLNKNNRLPFRFGSTSLKKTRTRNNDDNSLPQLDTTSQAFLTTLEDSLAAFNLTEIIVAMSEDMSRLEIPIITAEEDSPQAWYSVLATQPLAITNQEEPLTGLSVKDNGIVSLVFVDPNQQYYESALLPTVDSTLAEAIMEAFPAAIIEQSLDGEITFTLENKVHRVKMDYIVTTIDSNSSQLLVDMIDVNGDQKMDYILSARGKQQIAFGQ